MAPEPWPSLVLSLIGRNIGSPDKPLGATRSLDEVAAGDLEEIRGLPRALRRWSIAPLGPPLAAPSVNTSKPGPPGRPSRRRVGGRRQVVGSRGVGYGAEAPPPGMYSRRDGAPGGPEDSSGVGRGPARRSTATDNLRSPSDDVILAPEKVIERAVGEASRRLKLVVEGYGAVGIAAAMEKSLPPDLGRICFVLSGSNIDEDRFKNLLV